MRLIDAHTHLNTTPLVNDRTWYLQKFIDAGGVGLVNFWASESYNIQWIDIAKVAQKEFPSCIVKMALWWHPLECVERIITVQNIFEKMQQLRTLYVDNKEYIVAIGETWIDLHYPNGIETLEVQKNLFVQHCNLAREIWLPLVVHSRDAFNETLEVLRNYKDLTIYFHCWGYWPQEFEMLHSIFEKLFIGFCGNVTYKKAYNLRETLQIVPLTQLLLETDAPYLAPQVVRWETNHPAYIKYLYEYVAEFLGIEKNILSQHIEYNFKCLYSL